MSASSSSHHMEGSGISKKRKSGSCHDDLALIEEDGEEKKMEEFFSLVRSIREVRDHLRNDSSAAIKEGESRGEGKRNKLVEEAAAAAAAAVWNPSFQPEDFVEDRDHHDATYKVKLLQAPPPPPPMDSPTKGTRTSNNEDTTDALDLNLSL